MATSLESLNTTGDQSVELGRGANAPGDYAIAIGACRGDETEGEVEDGTFAVGDEAVAIGRGAIATGDGACQIGSGTNASDDTLQFQSQQVPLEDDYNALVTYAASDRILNQAALAIDGADATQWETANTVYYRIAGIQYSAVANTGDDFDAAHVVTALKFGIILIQINAAGTWSTKVPAATQAYDSAALALAALPDPDTGNVAVGYIIINADAGDWTANTDDMTDGSDLTTATFTDVTLATAPDTI